MRPLRRRVRIVELRVLGKPQVEIAASFSRRQPREQGCACERPGDLDSQILCRLLAEAQKVFKVAERQRRRVLSLEDVVHGHVAQLDAAHPADL